VIYTNQWSTDKEAQLNKLIAEKTKHMKSITEIADIMQKIVELFYVRRGIR